MTTKKISAPKILVIGANGQIGSELVEALALKYGHDAVLATDLAPLGRVPGIRYEVLDCLDAGNLPTQLLGFSSRVRAITGGGAEAQIEVRLHHVIQCFFQMNCI